MSRAFTVTDLGFGDSGKGSITDALCRKHNVKLVIRSNGGSQCAHNVCTPEGLHHTFATWGAGTFAGARTILTKDVLIDPYRLSNEAEVLEQKGQRFLARKIIVDRSALVITPFHRVLNRLKELAREQDQGRHGSCGIGIGETARYALEHPDDALRMGDLECVPIAIDKLRLIQDRLFKEAQALDVWSSELIPFTNDDTIDATLWRFNRSLNWIRLERTENILAEIEEEDTVWEGAQGVLLDEDVGFHPYTTWSHVGLRNPLATLAAAGITNITNIGVTRCYGHRHGAGPFPSEDEAVRPLVAEPHNPTNEWQSKFRVGWFDAVLADYAVRAVGGTIHELAITHVDRLASRTMWPIVTDYGIKVDPVDPQDFEKRQQLTDTLMAVRPEDRRVDMVAAEWVPDQISEWMGAPIGIISRGPTHADKTFVESYIVDLT